MHKFKFLDENTNPNDTTENDSAKPEPFEAKEVLPDLNIVKEVLGAGCVNLFRCGKEINLKYLASNIIDILIDKTNNSPILKAEKDYSDLVTGVYEGGLKVWECTYDLAKFINQYKICLNDKTVLDLGCGAGIIGILAVVNGARVYFQDYNEEIIKYVTIPNMYLNKSDVDIDNCKFFAGDWNSFISLASAFETEETKCDYIFTCETIYNPDSYKKLHAVFNCALKKDGAIYLAAKTHYFGVGGGLRQFEEFLTREGVFNFKTCWNYVEGVKREILKITFKDADTM